MEPRCRLEPVRLALIACTRTFHSAEVSLTRLFATVDGVGPFSGAPRYRAPLGDRTHDVSPFYEPGAAFEGRPPEDILPFMPHRE